MKFLQQYQSIISQAIIDNKFNGRPDELYAPMNYIMEEGGKRMRPVMTLMACDLFDGAIQKALKPALAIEYFHNFTLIHDDIMDEAPLRRNRPTIHTLHGINIGILAGDNLLFKAYQYFLDLEPILFKKCLEVFTNSGILVCEGQQLDVNFETMTNVSHDDYITMISYKTGALSAASLQIGAIIGGASDQDAEAIYNFGKHLGIAFQIMDDYLDVYGNQEIVGKKHAGDIYENKKTILYLTALEHATDEEKSELLFWYSKNTDNADKIYGVEKIFRRTKVEEKVLNLVQEHNHSALQFLAEINLPEEKKQPLIELSNYLLKREK